MSSADILDLFLRFASLSMLAIGGAIGMAPEMRRFMVDEHAWISGMQFTDSIVIAQAAPGPNILFIALICCPRALPPGGAGGSSGPARIPSRSGRFAWACRRSPSA